MRYLRYTHILALWASFVAVLAATNSSDLINGFSEARLGYSAGDVAQCVSGKVAVSISSSNTRLLLGNPTNQTVATLFIQELLQAGSTIATRSSGSTYIHRATHQLDVTLCYPAKARSIQNVETVQVLTTGAGFDKAYWDIAPRYSYVDAAAEAGYATLAYDRLGIGASDHPDPLQIVQCPTDVEVLHALVQILRKGGVASKAFKHVVGVGHSYGSIVQLSHNAKYPADVDAAVLTGFVNNLDNFPYTTAAYNPSIARFNDPSRFGNLPTGYLVHGTRVSAQLPLFRHPYFDPHIFEKVYATKSTYTLGQLLTLANIYRPAPAFRGPVDIIIGQHDFPFCLGDCNLPRDQAAATIPSLYPAAGRGSQAYIVPKCGHLLNAHYQAPETFDQINRFLSSNGF